MITFNKIGTYGRFGNQMFQYATLFSIAKARGYDFGVPYNRRNENKYFDFCLPDVFPNLTALDSSQVIPTSFYIDQEIIYNENIFNIKDGTDICGYFQCEKYFCKYKNELQNEFTFNKHFLDEAINLKNKIKGEVVSLHLRLGDYLQLSHTYQICSIEYYKKALNLLPNDVSILVFSDDIELAKQMLCSLNKSLYFIEKTNQYTDMTLMTLCDYHIIANSSFSWWGAWLSKSKKIIAPSKWLQDNPSLPKNWKDIYCQGWEII